MKWFSGWAFPASSLAAFDEKTSQFPMIGSWSLGSFQSLEMAMKNPRSIRGMILISSTPRFCATDDFEHGLSEASLRAMQRSLSRDSRATLEGFHKLCAEPVVLSEDELSDRVEKSLSLGIEALAAGLRELREKDFRSEVSKIEVPVLLLHGDEDRVIPVGASRWLAANLPHAKLVTLPGAGHDLPVRNADWVAAEISRFAGELA
jgi:pimeloyl-[acyl-carrier protein] methyl ester esterase